MVLTYGSKFADLWNGVAVEKVKEFWGQELGEYTREEIATGVAALKTRDWPPTLPEFLKLCRPPIEPMTAYAEACDKYPRFLEGETVGWSRLEIYWAAQAIGAWDLKNIPYRTIEGRWKEALATAARTAPPAPKKAISTTSSAHADPEVHARVAEGLRKLGGVRKILKPIYDPVAEARQVYDNAAREVAEAEIASRESGAGA